MYDDLARSKNAQTRAAKLVIDDWATHFGPLMSQPDLATPRVSITTTSDASVSFPSFEHTSDEVGEVCGEVREVNVVLEMAETALSTRS